MKRDRELRTPKQITKGKRKRMEKQHTHKSRPEQRNMTRVKLEDYSPTS
jgi:hypothetical protein